MLVATRFIIPYKPHVISAINTFIFIVCFQLNLPSVDKIKDQPKNYPPGILRPGQSFKSHIGHTVINLSDVPLSNAQVQVLEKGLTFCLSPTHQPDLSKIWTDVIEFQRKLELESN